MQLAINVNQFEETEVWNSFNMNPNDNPFTVLVCFDLVLIYLCCNFDFEVTSYVVYIMFLFLFVVTAL